MHYIAGQAVYRDDMEKQIYKREISFNIKNKLVLIECFKK